MNARGRSSVRWVLPVLALVLALTASACGDTIRGEATGSFGDVDPGNVAGLPVTDGPNGLRPGVPDATLSVRNSDGGTQDQFAINALSDILEYWRTQMPATFGKQFRPLHQFDSYDSRNTSQQVCGIDGRGLVNALYCTLDDSVAWDRGTLLPFVRKRFGALAVVSIFAHEMGHAVQYRASDKTGITQDSLTLVKEQQADCFAGAFFRWVATGHAKHFQMNTGSGLNQVLATMLFVRDQPGEGSFNEQGAHGSAFDRMFALQSGFAEGPGRCARINEQEVGQRITQQTFSPNDVNGGNLPVNQTNVAQLGSSLQAVFAPTGVPKVRLIAGNGSCNGGVGTPPVSYCPGDNTLNLDIQTLQRYGTPPAQGQDIASGQGGIGDFAAFAEIASRYALAVQDHLNFSLNDAKAGLRTTCLTGAWSGAIRKEGAPGPLTLSPGDLDEALAELLLPRSVISADDDGNRVRSGFARIEAFRLGFLNGSEVCTQRFR